MPDAFVFSCEPDSRQPIRPNTVAKRFTKKAKALGHGYTLYGLRHFMATQLGAVASANTVRSRMGHGSLAITRICAHPVKEADRAAARYMGDLLDGQANWHPTGRAITNAVAIVVLGPAFLATLRRAARRVHISPR
jgi:hypothetical protein